MSDSKWKKSPHRRRRTVRNENEIVLKKPVNDEKPATDEAMNDEVPPVKVPMTFQQVLRERAMFDPSLVFVILSHLNSYSTTC